MSLVQALTYVRITPSDKEALPTGVCWGGPRELLQGPSAVAAYYNFLASHSFSVCLPFRLRAIGAPLSGVHKSLDGTGASAGAELGGAPSLSIWGSQGSFSLSALYSIELFFSHSPHYRPLHSVCIPFLQSPIAGPEAGPAVGSQAEAWSPLTKNEEKILQEASEDAFPFNYEIILKYELQLLALLLLALLPRLPLAVLSVICSPCLQCVSLKTTDSEASSRKTKCVLEYSDCSCFHSVSLDHRWSAAEGLRLLAL